MSLIKSPSEIVIKPTIKALFYGEPGIGKSTIALSAPSPLLLDFDNGVHRVSAEHRCPTVQVSSWSEAKSVLNEDLSSFDSIVVDTAGKMLESIEQELAQNKANLQRNGALKLQAYGLRNREFKSFLQQLSILGKHVIFIAHATYDKDDDHIYARPDIGGKNGDSIYKELDLMGYMYATENGRAVAFEPSSRYYAKNSCNVQPITAVPDLSSSPNTLVQTFVDSYRDNIEKGKALAVKRDELVDSITEKAEAVDSIDLLNAFADWCKGLEHIQDSMIQARERVKSKAKELGAKFNSEAKCYE